jgi:hypothetical protein
MSGAKPELRGRLRESSSNLFFSMALLGKHNIDCGAQYKLSPFRSMQSMKIMGLQFQGTVGKLHETNRFHMDHAILVL